MQASRLNQSSLDSSLTIPSPYYYNFNFADYFYKVPLSHRKVEKLEDFIKPSFVIIGDVTIDGEYGYSDGISLSHCTFEGELLISNYTATKSIGFNNCIFKKKLQLADISTSSLHISGQSLSDIRLHNIKASNSYISLEGYKNLHFEKLEGKEILCRGLKGDKTTILNCQVNKINIITPTIATLDIYSSSNKVVIGEEIASEKSSFSSIDILDYKIFNNDINDQLTINKVHLKILRLAGDLKSTSSILKDLKISELINFRNFNCNGKLKLHNIFIKNSIIEILSSDLGKSEFINVAFDSLKHISVIDSKISDCNLSMCPAPKKIIGENKIDHTGARDAIKQLKLAYSKSGDKIQEMSLSPYEYDEHFKSLAMWSNWTNFFDKFILFLNKKSNFYGHDIGVAFISIVLSSIFFFSLFCYSLGFRLGNDFAELRRILSYIFEFVNPLHKPEYIISGLLNTKEIDPSQISNYTRVCEGISKIFITFFLYQFIQAFRKFGKS
ncbi:hypothetical protein FAES_1957 [Fibrella aestuarina BUZ 2]|uniref:Membrane-associated oxidoreductase n=2 Tax=Fibrella TaxID=861914 RepID=I0K763_9BACT|nr:hypothetical protein FAES_1957 [Fibrella aestuarina BUZ 2]